MEHVATQGSGTWLCEVIKARRTLLPFLLLHLPARRPHLPILSLVRLPAAFCGGEHSVLEAVVLAPSCRTPSSIADSRGSKTSVR